MVKKSEIPRPRQAKRGGRNLKSEIKIFPGSAAVAQLAVNTKTQLSRAIGIENKVNCPA